MIDNYTVNAPSLEDTFYKILKYNLENNYYNTLYVAPEDIFNIQNKIEELIHGNYTY